MVYFIQESGNNSIKIGFTENSAEKRMKTLQVGMPYKLSVLAVMEGDIKEEKRIQRRFLKSRLMGEWFENTPELIGFIKDIQLKNTHIASRKVKHGSLKEKIEDLERDCIKSALMDSKWDVYKSADGLKITERQIRYKIKKYNLLYIKGLFK